MSDARAALLDYAREWAAGPVGESEIQALLAALRPDRSPMWRWGVFENLASAVALADPVARDWCLGHLAPGGGS